MLDITIGVHRQQHVLRDAGRAQRSPPMKEEEILKLSVSIKTPMPFKKSKSATYLRLRVGMGSSISVLRI